MMQEQLNDSFEPNEQIEEPVFFDPSLRAPFPWYGGKSKAAPLIWKALGDVKNYVEPFAGSLATLLARPHSPKVETVNDKDAWIANFWRAVKHEPRTVAEFADWPINEADLSARHLWLVNQRSRISERLTIDPDYYDPKVAGWWVWGVSAWIGSGWCDGIGPWYSNDNETWSKRSLDEKHSTAGIRRMFPIMKPSGVHSRTNNWIEGISKILPDLMASRGVHRRTTHKRKEMKPEELLAWFDALSARLRRVRVTCGDWQRVVCNTATVAHGITGVLLDPPYDLHDGTDDLYVEKDIVGLSKAVGDWAIAHGNDKRMRIVLCGYEGTFEPPPGWQTIPWFNGSAVGRGSEKAMKSRFKERLWISPHCFLV